MQVKRMSRTEVHPGLLRVDFELESGDSVYAAEMYRQGYEAEQRLSQAPPTISELSELGTELSEPSEEYLDWFKENDDGA